MSAVITSSCTFLPRAAARVASVCVMTGKKCKRVAGLNAGLLMVKKSKKRNPT
ncbi:hypothetical protein SAMN06265337_1556 [Hymenobacter gelipurpurascens]|uniref:Uncharacterized protein n=1 Tax=Hymenobacter gelipurpurascens TaxID=89968 RepID=A0A212TJX8_9BACT|nr:hypothetical protein SAMN06265337_1556 [Hymenobacter gelipurpurascens]